MVQVGERFWQLRDEFLQNCCPVRLPRQEPSGWPVALSASDRTYLAQTEAARTGIPQADAEQKFDTVIAQLNDASLKACQATDTARKRSAQLSIVGALAMLIGAVIASVSAALGGSIGDEY